MAVVDELVAILGYKIDGKEKLREFSRGMDQTEKEAKSSAARIAAVGARIGAVAGAAITVAGAVTARAVKQYADFERVMTRIGITAGASVSETRAATDQVLALAKQFALTREEAVSGLDTLTASGMDLKEAMSFLPSVLLTAQAAGASTEDIANTAIKTSSALKIQAGQMQQAFDIMVAGGKAGQFELKDMASFIPELANSFSALGYSGLSGLQQLIALMQTLRERTGTAGAAATQAQNIFGKMVSQETIQRFKKFGIDLQGEMKKAKANGEDAISAFVRLSEQALKGDLTKLPLLFSDQEFRLGMQALITGADSYRKFLADVSGSKVNGSALRDFSRISDETKASIDRMSLAWDTFMMKLGRAAAPGATALLEGLSNALDNREDAANKAAAVDRALANKPWQERIRTLAGAGPEEIDELARRGGYAPTEADRKALAEDPEGYAMWGRLKPRGGVRPAKPPIIGNGGPWNPQIYRDQWSPINSMTMGNPAPAPAQTGSEQPGWVTEMWGKIQELLGNGKSTEATLNDNRQDNRQFPVTVSAPVTVNVQQPAQAPAAVGAAVSGAVRQGVEAQPARMQAGPAAQ